jgi:hypothetical protein
MDPKDKAKKKARAVLEFSNIGIKMLVTILLFFYIGKELDERSESGKANWTLILTLTGVGVALYFMIKGLLNLTR